jgi:hypothetical protein
MDIFILNKLNTMKSPVSVYFKPADLGVSVMYCKKFSVGLFEST